MIICFIIFGICDLKLCFLFLCHENSITFFFPFLPFLPGYSVFVIPFSVYVIAFSVYVNNFHIFCYVKRSNFLFMWIIFRLCYFYVTFQEVFSTLSTASTSGSVRLRTDNFWILVFVIFQKVRMKKFHSPKTKTQEWEPS